MGAGVTAVKSADVKRAQEARMARLQAEKEAMVALNPEQARLPTDAFSSSDVEWDSDDDLLQPPREPEPEPGTCLLCGAQVGVDHIAEHFTKCFDEHCPVDTTTPSVDVAELTQTHSVASRKEMEEIDQLQSALFDESSLGGELIPSSVILSMLQMLDMPTLMNLGSVNRGWQRVCRASSRVRCAHALSQLVQLLPARHRPLACDYLGHTSADQCRGTYRLEQQQMGKPRWAGSVDIFVRYGDGCNTRMAAWRVTTHSSTSTAVGVVDSSWSRFGTLGVVCVGDLHSLIQDKIGIPPDMLFLVDRSRLRPAVHLDVPLICYAEPYLDGDMVCVSFVMLMPTSVNRIDRESKQAYEAMHGVRPFDVRVLYNVDI